MSTQYGGLTANVTATPPATVAITSSTDATPIVITSAAAHGIHTGDKFYVVGHTVNVNANGFWIAGTVTSNTVVLLGSTATGGGAGGATGSTLSLAFTQTFALPIDGEAFNAASWNVACEALADRAAFLWATIGWAQSVYAGGITSYEASSKLVIKSGATLAVNAAGALTLLSGSLTSMLGRTTARPIVFPSDADQTLDVTQGDVFILADPVGERTIKLATTSVVPMTDESMDLIYNLSGAAAHPINIRREDTTPLIQLNAKGERAQVRFYGGVWRGLWTNVPGAIDTGW